MVLYCVGKFCFRQQKGVASFQMRVAIFCKEGKGASKKNGLQSVKQNIVKHHKMLN